MGQARSLRGVASGRKHAPGKSAGKCDHRNPCHTRAFQRMRRGSRGRAGDQHVVHERHRFPRQGGASGRTEDERARHVPAASVRREGNLAGAVAYALQRLDDSGLEGVSLGGREQRRLVVPALPHAGPGRRHGHDHCIRQGTDARHARPHGLCEAPPAAVLESMHEGVGRRLQHRRGAGTHQRSGPFAALQACGARRATRAPRKAAARTTRPGRFAQRGGTRGTDEGPGRVQAEWGHTPQAAGRKKKAEQLGQRGERPHPRRRASSAARIASTGASRPHQRSNDTAPCCTSISAPSVAGTPKARASRTKGVAASP